MAEIGIISTIIDHNSQLIRLKRLRICLMIWKHSEVGNGARQGGKRERNCDGLGVGGEYVQMSVVPLALPLAGAMTYLFYLFSNEPPE